MLAISWIYRWPICPQSCSYCAYKGAGGNLGHGRSYNMASKRGTVARWVGDGPGSICGDQAGGAAGGFTA